MLTRKKGHTLREASRRRRVRQRTRAGPSTGSTGEHPVLPVEGAARFAATADEPREASSRRCAQAHRHGHAALAQGEHQCSLHAGCMRAVSEARARLETRVPVHVSRIHRVRVTPALDSCAHRAITARSARRTSLPRARRWQGRGLCTCRAAAAVRVRACGARRSRPCLAPRPRLWRWRTQACPRVCGRYDWRSL